MSNRNNEFGINAIANKLKLSKDHDNMGHAATKPDKVNMMPQKDFRGSKLPNATDWS